MLVKNLMSSDVITVKDNITITEAADLMSRNSISYLPVLNSNNKVYGYVSQASVIKNILGKDGKIKNILVSDIMTRQNAVLDAEMDIHDACEVMASNKQTVMPVVNSKGICGILSIRDLSQKRIYLAEISEIIAAKYKNR